MDMLSISKTIDGTRYKIDVTKVAAAEATARARVWNAGSDALAEPDEDQTLHISDIKVDVATGLVTCSAQMGLVTCHITATIANGEIKGTAKTGIFGFSKPFEYPLTDADMKDIGAFMAKFFS